MSLEPDNTTQAPAPPLRLTTEEQVTRIALVLAVAVTVWTQVLPTVRSPLFQRWIRPDVDVVPTSLSQRFYYEQVTTAIAPAGNLFMRFQLTPEHAAAAERFYYHASYVLYPRKVFVATEPVVVNNGLDLVRLSSAPGPEWLREHGVNTVATVWASPDGEVNLNVAPVSPKSPRSAPE